jgi:glyoxylase-like metal-dependent hydrolase (beta-lactamase superfamily II)
VAPDDVHEVYALKYGQLDSGVRGHYFHGTASDPHDEPMRLDYYVWLVRGRGHDIVVDTGFTRATAARRERTIMRSPAEALTSIGVEVGRVPLVILSHMHYDHVGDVEPFSGARFVIQDSEMAFWTGRHLSRQEFRYLVELEDLTALIRLNFEGRMLFVDGVSELVPGITVHHVGGHTAGLQVVRVNTAAGPVVLAADAAHFYANIEQDAPFGIVTDLAQMYRAFDTMRSLAVAPRYIVPGHDPLVLERFAPVDGQSGLSVRIA